MVAGEFLEALRGEKKLDVLARCRDELDAHGQSLRREAARHGHGGAACRGDDRRGPHPVEVVVLGRAVYLATEYWLKPLLCLAYLGCLLPRLLRRDGSKPSESVASTIEAAAPGWHG